MPLLALFTLPLLTGCLPPQPRGAGKLQYLVEPASQRGYYLYLPKDYVAADEVGRAARRWPVVMTFHGMKPYDTASYQAQEWEQEADRYGFVVIAPILKAFVFVLGEFPLRTLNKDFKSDEVDSLAVLDEVLRSTHGDPGNVLSTSWSSGGYMAHYMLNRRPDRFTCLAVRQSNFSATVLDSGLTAQSLYHPVLIIGTEKDLPICKEESRDAIRWYESHGYKNLAWVHMRKLGHERTPEMAATFFARVCGATPNKSQDVLVARQAIDGNPTGLALLAGKLRPIRRPVETAPALAEPGAAVSAAPARPTLTPATQPAVVAQPPEVQPVREPTPPRGTLAAVGAQRPVETVAIRVSSAVGFEPLVLVYSAECPPGWQRTATFGWYLDAEKIGDGLNGQRTLTVAGDHTLELKVVTQEGGEHRATRQIRVLRSVESPPNAAQKQP